MYLVRDLCPEYINNSDNTITKISHLILKYAKGLNKLFSKENMPVANKYMKKCSTLFVIREMQSKPQ